MESTSPSQSQGSSEQSYEGLKLNLNPVSGFDFIEQDLQDMAQEDDLELLEYQRSRSTPKIEIQEFLDDEKTADFKEQQEKHKKEIFSHVLFLSDRVVLRAAPEGEDAEPQVLLAGGSGHAQLRT